MARPGVTYSEVAKVAIELVEAGRTPTIELVRTILGTGSSTTISNHLKKWREKQSSATLVASKEHVPDELSIAVKSLWALLIDKSEEEVADIESRYDKKMADIESSLSKYKNNNKKWQEMFSDWTREREKLIKQNKLLSQKVAELDKVKDRFSSSLSMATVQIKERDNRIKELHTALQQNQTNLEQYRQSTKQNLAMLRKQYEGEKETLKSDVKLLKNQLNTLTVNNQAMQESYTLLKSSYRVLEKEYSSQNSKVEEMEVRCKQLEGECIGYKEQLDSIKGKRREKKAKEKK